MEEKNTKQFVHYAGALFLTVAAVAVLWQMVGPSWFKNIKAEVTNQPYARTITVSGEGKVTTKPDIAVVSFSVATTAKTVKEATDQGNKKMNEVIESLKKMGIDSKDLVTTQYSLQPQYDDVMFEPVSLVAPSIMRKPEQQPTNPVPVPPQKSLTDLLDEYGIDETEAMELYAKYISGADPTGLLEELGLTETEAKELYAKIVASGVEIPLKRAPRVPQIVGYSLNQTVQVKVRKLEEVDQVIDSAVKAGSNQVGQLYFDIDDPSQVEKEAREKAFAEARKKAEEMSAAAGVGLGRVVTFSEGYGYMPYSRMVTTEMQDAGTAAPTIEPGSKEISLNVSVTYEIE